jgi:hypothetical protein
LRIWQNSGKWTQEEQGQLKQAVDDLSAQQGKSIGHDGFGQKSVKQWGGSVAENNAI